MLDHTRWKTKFGVLEVEVNDLGKGMHLCDSEVANELREAVFELRVCALLNSVANCGRTRDSQTTGSKQFFPSIVKLD